MVRIVVSFLSSEKESVLLSSGDDLNPIHAKVRYCVEIIITNYILCRPTGGRPRLDPRARIQLGQGHFGFFFFILGLTTGRAGPETVANNNNKVFNINFHFHSQ